jgi:phosphohistidine phosphatase SixA
MRLLVSVLLASVLLLPAPTAGQQPVLDVPLELARARDPGIVTLLRHAQAPGIGDPANFTLADCATQRNLSEAGRRYARRLGEAFRVVGVRDADVRTSQWCRCVETARLLGVGSVHTAPYLNSFFAGRGDEAASTQALRAAIVQKLDSRRPTLLVTHQVNITALTGVVPSEGEVVFVRATAAGTVAVVARVRIQ